MYYGDVAPAGGFSGQVHRDDSTWFTRSPRYYQAEARVLSTGSLVWQVGVLRREVLGCHEERECRNLARLF